MVNKKVWCIMSAHLTLGWDYKRTTGLIDKHRREYICGACKHADIKEADMFLTKTKLLGMDLIIIRKLLIAIKNKSRSIV